MAVESDVRVLVRPASSWATVQPVRRNIRPRGIAEIEDRILGAALWANRCILSDSSRVIKVSGRGLLRAALSIQTRRGTEYAPAKRTLATFNTFRTPSSSMASPRVVRPLPCKKQSACRPASDCNDRDGDLGFHTGAGRRSRPIRWRQRVRGPFDEGEVLRLTRGSLGRAGVAF